MGKVEFPSTAKRKILRRLEQIFRILGLRLQNCTAASESIRSQRAYDTYQFSREEISFNVSSTAFATLLVALGAPHGKKASQDYRVPQWIKGAPLWQKRLFLATLFGAELESPSTMTGHPYTISAPKMSMSKREGYVDSGVSFLRDIGDLLADFGVQTKKIGQRKEQTNADGSPSYRLRLVISGTNENLIKLWGQIGFEYNAERKNARKCCTPVSQTQTTID